MATVTCKTADGVERTVTVESENTCPLYSYGEEHKEYTGAFEKASAPNNPAYYNAPANSTPVAPPEAVLAYAVFRFIFPPLLVSLYELLDRPLKLRPVSPSIFAAS